NATVGVVTTEYYPIGGTANQFRLYSMVTADTMIMSVGVGSDNYRGTAVFRGRVKNGIPAEIHFFQ
ncbi:MAG: hypothetical protein EBZ77_16305, partial [Chitinophagia bacterium]|nr:hypothetical protein [Chitinophagia bacterium]